MEDREFIAQMAQFSSLEQMTNMSRQFTELTATLKGAQAMNLIGRDVEITRGEAVVRGTVEAVTGGTFPQILVDGAYYDFEDITRVTR
jgi:flagellar basal-body rod modification protein FlgD